MNKWLDVYGGKKTFLIGDIVFWDRLIFTKPQLETLIVQYGPQYFEILSLSYDAVCTGVVYGEWVNIGRQGIYTTRTNPRNLIKITP